MIIPQLGRSQKWNFSAIMPSDFGNALTVRTNDHLIKEATLQSCCYGIGDGGFAEKSPNVLAGNSFGGSSRRNDYKAAYKSINCLSKAQIFAFNRSKPIP